ncbi:deleted in malignant brain tumors 1 protein-like [Pezoporus occidentalis]|uniref:deleted in malignant brain tumors 1 protein-like n=1 Tax=Pezoporus occidentalis TaxID=407982 RepID=UPI002F91B8EC
MATPAGIHPSSRSGIRCGRGGAKSVGTLLLTAWLWGASNESPAGSLRLEGGPSRCAGRVEVLHNGTWGTVCDDGWGFGEGQVVCRELGCGMVLSVAPGSRYGEGKGPIWLDEVNCTGEEKALRECRAKPWGEHNCNHIEDASVECSDSIVATLGTLQLVNGLDRCAGRVEVLHEHMWGTVCDDGWDLLDAAVVCRQLGCGTALAATHGAHFGRGHDPIWLDEVNCTGTEAALVDCQASMWGNNNCFHGEDAGVVCSDSALSAATAPRLADGLTRCDGRVEVPHLGSWASLCDQDWGLAEARVLCRQLGCGTALVAPARSRSGHGAGPTWPNRVSCVGTESTLSMCKVQARGNGSCPHGHEAVVTCSGNSEGDQVRLVNYGSRCAGRVEIYHNQQWGTVCDDNWDLVDADVVCRQLDCGRALSAPGRGQFGRGDGIIWMDETNCTGTESALSSCPARPWGTGNCYHGEDAGVVCSDSLIPEPAPIRLANASHPCAGRVEVLHGEHWGAVCKQGWDQRDAEVACRELGCGTALPASEGADFGTGALPVSLENVRCQGTEQSLRECPAGRGSCEHGQRAGVVCSGSIVSSFAPVRLVNGSGHCSGRVEVFHAGQWGTVCDDGWDLLDAKVLCRQLGCGTAVLAPHRAHYGQGQGPIWLDAVRCAGTEAALAECRSKGWGTHGCEHGEDAGVICSGSGISDLGSLRLVNGSDACSGRVEVFHEQRWGGICSEGWDLAEAHVVCGQLGCGTARAAPAAPRFGMGDGFLWVDAAECAGTEGSLLECRLKLWGEESCRSKAHAAVVCSAAVDIDPRSSEALRLVNGPHRCAGRVEVFHSHQWGTVCDDGWDLLDAAVVCRQLGCGAALSAPGLSGFGQGSGPIWLDGVSCLGTEGTIAECPGKPWGQHACNHVEDASVVCAGSGIASSPRLRLVGGLSECSGRVEVFYANKWGTICDDNWDLQDAAVVCRALGCGAAALAPGSARFGWGTGPIWLDNVNCTGQEIDFFQCPAKMWGIHNCHHGEDAGVVCAGNSSSAALRLMDGPHGCAGRVEVLHEGQWGTVCDDGWDLTDAAVVCHQLGCGGVEAAPLQARFKQGTGPIWLDDVACTGSEEELAQCHARPWGQNNCHHGEDAGVVCSGSSSPNASSVRLTDGPHRCAGRVEVLHADQWGTVCDDAWDLSDADVVCRQLGCGRAREAPGRARFGQGTGRIWLDDVGCTGDEDALAQCQSHPWGRSNCHHGEDAGVVCSDANLTAMARIRLADGPNRCAGRVEVEHEHQWGTICDDGWDLNDAKVICRQLGCGAAVAAPGHARFGAGGDPIWLDNAECAGTESAFGQCDHGIWGLHNCNHNEDAGVVCSGPNPLQLRVQDGAGPCAGRLEVLYNGSWLGVCGTGWSLLEAAVACRQLGCGAAQAAPMGAPLDREHHRVLLEGLSCHGTESLLLECQQSHTGPGPCPMGPVATVVCAEPKGAPSSCSALIALLVLVMLLSGILLWLFLKRRCIAAAQAGAHQRLRDQDAPSTSFQAMGAIYLPSTAEGPEEDTEMMQLMEEDAAQ